MRTQGIVLGLTATLVTLCSPAASEAATRARFGAETVLSDASVRISTGGGFSCQVNEDGTIRCWGANNRGQLGNGLPTDARTVVPVRVSGITTAVAVAAGGNFACALLVDGRVRCWGSNANGELGDGEGAPNIQRAVPVAVSGITNAVAISAGSFHACALLAAGTVRCWGFNSDGQTGFGSVSAARLTPVAVSGLSNAIAVAAGAFHTCALLANGAVRCWGSNTFGQLGIGTFGGRQVTPVAVTGLLTPATAIALGPSQSCALLANGTARCWGRNGGALGDGTTADRAEPARVKGLTNIAAIDPPCALQANSHAHCWGDNRDGQIGDGTTTNSLIPVRVGTNIKLFVNAVAISASGGHTCALMADGSANCWGLNLAGQVGSGNAPSIITPALVVGGGGSVAARDVAAGRSHTCAVRANGTVACWGSNGAGQLGDGTTTNRLSPVPVAGLTDPVVAIAAGEAHTCVLVATGTARCWGDNSSGQLGDGTNNNRLAPVVVNGVANAVGIATGGALGSSHSCAVLADGTARCWGANGSGQLGTGDATPSRVAVRVSGLTRAVDIAVGEFHSCALTANGLPFCWGFNGRGQVGNANLGNHFVPIFVGLDNVVTLAGGNSHTCGLRTDGTQWCWGGNLLGQLGSNSPDPQTLPTLVGTSSPFQAVGIAGGFGHSCAVVSDGSARCWGDNGSGQLGNSTVPSSIEPVTVGRLIGNLATFFSRTTGVVSVTTGRRHSCTLQVSGGVSCWGDNTFGQIGINSIATSQGSPAGVLSFTLNIDPKVVLESNQQVSTVTILANCRGGRQLHVDVTLTQGDVTGHGAATGSCSGGLRRYPVRVSTQALNGYSVGAAQVSAEALIRASGKVVNSQQWTRAVQINSAP